MNKKQLVVKLSSALNLSKADAKELLTLLPILF